MITDVKAFTAEYETHIDAKPDEVWDALHDLNEWFPHRFVAGSDYIQELGLLGRGYEDWGDGLGALFSINVVMRRPDLSVRLIMPGVFGAWMATYTVKLTDEDGGTKLAVSVYGMGDVDERNEQMYNNGWPGVFGALKDYLAKKR